MSRGARLAALSSRMRKEFDSSAEKTLEGDTSWLNNLHPWHKRILSKPDNHSEKIPDIPETPESPALKSASEPNFDTKLTTPTTSRAESPVLVS